MPKPASSNPNDEPSCTTPRFRPNWLAALVNLLAGGWLLVAMMFYDPKQSGLFVPGDTTAKIASNPMGGLGTDFARLGFVWLGLGAWLVPVFCLWTGWLAIWHARRLVVSRFVAMVLAVAAMCGLAAMLKLDSLAHSAWFPEGRLGGDAGWLIYDKVLRSTLGGFTAVLLDLTMPRLDGAEVLREIRALNPATRVLIMSGYSEQDILDRLRGLGPIAILHKPFTLKILLTRLGEVIAG